ncbi:MAG: amiD [Francisellaceae bacterium]|nr:amiD [Francisellaceae bacterium]
MQFQRRMVEKGYLGEKKWHPFPKAQTQNLINICQHLVEYYNIQPWNVVGHADIAPGRKQDPGPLFPWQKLAQARVGAWANSDNTHLIRQEGMSISRMQKALSSWGYKVPHNGKLDPETKNVLIAFQMHYRPERYDGILDKESMKIIDNLNHQRQLMMI